MNKALWAAAILLALAFAFGGFMKATADFPQMIERMPWVAGVPWWVTRLAGVSELLGAIGLILPAATRIKPQLTGVAALGLALVMVLAAALHLSRGEYSAIAINAVLGGLAGFVAYGRLKLSPIEPKVKTAAATA